MRSGVPRNEHAFECARTLNAFLRNCYIYTPRYPTSDEATQVDAAFFISGYGVIEERGVSFVQACYREEVSAVVVVVAAVPATLLQL